MPKQQITTKSVASPIGAYSQGLRAGEFRSRLRQRRRAAQQKDGGRSQLAFQPRRHATGRILTAHFLKSVCLEMGSVASSVTLLISCDASNQGT